jgi:hypothetical protein
MRAKGGVPLPACVKTSAFKVVTARKAVYCEKNENTERKTIPPNRRLSSSQRLRQINPHSVFSSSERGREERKQSEEDSLAGSRFPVYDNAEHIVVGVCRSRRLEFEGKLLPGFGDARYSCTVYWLNSASHITSFTGAPLVAKTVPLVDFKETVTAPVKVAALA